MRSSTLRIWWDATEVSFVLLSRTWGGPNIASSSPCFVLSSCGAGIAVGVPGAIPVRSSSGIENYACATSHAVRR